MAHGNGGRAVIGLQRLIQGTIPSGLRGKVCKGEDLGLGSLRGTHACHFVHFLVLSTVIVIVAVADARVAGVLVVVILRDAFF